MNLSAISVSLLKDGFHLFYTLQSYEGLMKYSHRCEKLDKAFCGSKGNNSGKNLLKKVSGNVAWVEDEVYKVYKCDNVKKI